MQRFFIDNQFIHNDRVEFPPAVTHQIELVLRLDLLADTVIVLDNSGMEYLVGLAGKEGRALMGEVLESSPGRSEPTVNLHLCFSLTKREKVEWILQKGTEIGVAIFRPFVSERSLDRNLKLDEAKKNRWQAIIREAAEQSSRSILPELADVASFQSAIKTSIENCSRLIAWEEANYSNQITRQRLADREGKLCRNVLLLIGPEGGFSAGEVAQAEANGFTQVSLGSRILRMETACIAASAVIFHLADSW
ncbi:MAG: RsmE family RNA methyltransferase [Anaerolineaceae bacterium]